MEHWYCDLSMHCQDNRGMTYIFVAVDVLTRKPYVEPMANKDGDNCAGALMSIFMEHKSEAPHVVG